MIQSLFFLFLLVNYSYSEEKFTEEGEARLAYYTTTGDGSTFATFNGTSMQNLVILGIISVVLASLLLPYLGLSQGLFGLFAGESSNTNRNDFPPIPALGAGASLVGNQGFKRRAGEIEHPVIKDLAKSQMQYED